MSTPTTRPRAGQAWVARKVLGRTKAFATNRLRPTTPQAPPRVPPLVSAREAGAYVALEPAMRTTMPRLPGFSDADWAVMTSRNIDELPETFVLSTEGASVVGTRGWVVTKDNALVRDIWQEAGSFPTETMYAESLTKHPVAATRHVEGTVGSLLIEWMPNYYHWTFQAIPRYEMYRKAGLLDKIEKWLVPADAPGYVGQWLDLLGITPDQRVEVADGESVTTERLIVSSIPAPHRYVQPWTVDWLRAQVPARPERPSRRVYITRRAGEARQLLNQDRLLPMLRDHGFETVELNGLSVLEQMTLFADATAVASVHGAGLTNLAFAPRHTQVIEVLPRNFTFPGYYKLAPAAEFRYQVSVGVEPRIPGPFYAPDRWADVIADEKWFAQALANLD